MADPLGIIGVIAVAGQILQFTVKLGLDWEDAPENAKSFLNEIQTLKTVLSETHTNIIVNEDFKAAFEGRRSVLLLELGDPNQPTSTSFMVDTCKQLLDDLFSDLKKRIQGHRFGWERLKGAFTNKKTKEAVENLHRHCQILNSLISLDALSLGLETHKEVKQARQEQQDWQNEQKSKEILDWLSPADYATQQSDFLRRRQAGTGKWLLESGEYQQWVAMPQATLFCPGIPGAGKTVLTSIVVDDLQNKFRHDKNVSIAYLYCNFRRQTEQTVEHLLASILRQLAQDQSSLPGSLRLLHDDQCMKGKLRPSLEQLSSTLQFLSKTLPRAFIIVDALDECQLADGSRAQFLDEIFALQSGSEVNLLATSRFIRDITDRFADAPSLEIRAHEEDVRRYLAGSISQLPACVAKSSELQEEIMTKIVAAVDGMFLLAQLHLNSLKGKRSAKIIRTALGALHTGSGAYDKAYDDAMERIAGQLDDQEELAKQVLMWITCAVRPLTIIELQEALAVEVGETELDPDNVPEIEDILSVCAGLVTVDEESNVIRLVHYTTQEYFSRTSDRWFHGAHCSITRICITYLSFDIFNAFPSPHIGEHSYARLKQGLVLRYAFSHWVDHASMPESQPCDQMVSDFLSDRLSVIRHETEFAMLKKTSKSLFESTYRLGRDELLRASQVGEARHIQYLLQRGALPNAWGINRCPPLWFATFYKHAGSVKALLEWGGTDVNCRDYKGETPLFIALKTGERVVIDMFLHMEGIDLTAVSDVDETLLHAAAAGGLEDLFRMFLAMDHNQDNLNKQDDGRMTPLHLAALYGHKAIVRILLDADGIDIHAKTGTGWTPLHWAAHRGHTPVVKIFLDFDVAVNIKTYQGETPLHLAAGGGHEDAIRAILDFDAAAINTKDKFGSTPLHEAARNGHEAVIQLLHDLDATAINSKTESGETPLHLAAEYGHDAVVEILLSLNGIEVNARKNDGATSLHYVAGNVRVLELLLNTGKLNASDEDHEGRTPIMVAAAGGYEKAVQYFLNMEGVDLDHTTIHGLTLLHCAAETGYPAVMKILVASGRFNVNQTTKSGATPLWLAAHKRKAKAVECLLGADGIDRGLNLKDLSGRTALSVAAEEGYGEIVRLLKEAHEKYGVEPSG